MAAAPSRIPPAPSGISRLFNPIKLLLLFVSVQDMDIFPKRLKLFYAHKDPELRDYLYFTNISLVYTAVSIMLGFMSRRGIWNTAYTFSLATALIMEIFVSLIFWILFSIDFNLVKNPRDGESIEERGGLLKEIPKHVLPALILLLEQRGVKIERDWRHRAFLIGFCGIYHVIAEAYLAKRNEPIYPFMKYLNYWKRLGFFAGLAVLTLVVYEVNMFLAHRIRRERKAVLRARRTRKRN